MFEPKYDPRQPYRYAQYGRMSGDRQNRRSPDQQFATIGETIARCGYPWQCVRTERDDAVSGRYLRKRAGLQRLLSAIMAGILVIDLLVVDTLERLGRAEEIAELRRKLRVEYGILVVAADNGFADPTGVVGKAVGMVEQMRSVENTRISRHNVIRGKKDAARRGRWPGGPPPFGYRLKRMLDNSVSPPEFYSVLEINQRAAHALKLAFERAAATGEGDVRLSQWWNASPDIPDEFKPISPPTMGYRLENPIAIGTLRWGANETGVINDTRIVRPNPDGPELIPDFCPPIVSAELFERVQKVRRLRGDQVKKLRGDQKDSGPTKLIAPEAPGLTLKYLLTGLVRCGTCKAAMRPVPSGRRSKAGRRYVYYTCPRHYDGACPNDRHVPEDRLREAVIARLRARLFPLPGPADRTPTWLPEILTLVRQEQQRYQAEAPDQDAADREALAQLEQQLAGWALTLANPQVPASVRNDIETRYARAKEQHQILNERQAARQALRKHLDDALDPQAVLAALTHLDKVLAEYCPTLGNIELGKHIDVIVCQPDGRVEMRGTMLGLFEGAAELLSRAEPSAVTGRPAEPGGFTPVVPRRRGRLRVPDLAADGKDLRESVDPVLDPERFAGLPECFFWKEEIVIAPNSCWSKDHAMEVGRERAKGKTHEQLAVEFGVSVPTIRKALRVAEQDGDAPSLPGKMPRPRWPEQHFEEVAAKHREGMNVRQLCQHFQRSEPLIRRALRLAEEHARRAKDPLQGDDAPPAA